jgi:hypothetical protein
MVYALRTDGGTITLVEVSAKKELAGKTWVSSKDARRWVLAGKLHETGLWVDIINGDRRRRVVRYAEPQE